MPRPTLHLIRTPCRGERNPPEIAPAPASLDDAPLRAALTDHDIVVAPPISIALTPDESCRSGESQRIGPRESALRRGRSRSRADERGA